MPSSEQPFAPNPMPTPETPQAVLAVASPIPQSADGSMGAVGVASVVRSPAGVSSYWMCGYSASLDMARAAMVQHLLSILPDTMPQLVVWSANMDALKHVPAARLNGGYRSGKNKNKPFGAYALFDPVEAALRDGRWFLQTFGKGEEPGDFDAAQRIADQALLLAREGVTEFPNYRKEHPDWHMLKIGTTPIPRAEHHEPS